MSQETIEKRVLALKYRPSRFEDLVGQSTVSQTLSLALDSNRLSHAYLLSGLRGSGKTSTARIMAKALLCVDGPTSKPCEVCANCKSANSNRHLDIIEMDAASNRGIDDIKDLIEHTKYKPSSARFKVFIIDEVHMLTPQAFNALLKTLEEPPGFVKFILATTDPLKLPATILSRTQHFRFNKISDSDVVHHLAHILNEENIDYEKEALEILSRSGQGSLRDTLTMLDQAIIFSKGKITTVSVVDMLGLIEPKLMDDIFLVILNKGDINQIIKDLESYEVSQICDEITIYLKDKMLSKDRNFDLLLFDRFFRILSDAKHLLALNSDGGFVLILTFLKMIEATNIRTIDDIINQIEKIEPKKEIAIPKTIERSSETTKIETIKVEQIIEKPIEIPVSKSVELLKENIEEFPAQIQKLDEVQIPINIRPEIELSKETKIEELTPFDEILIQSNNTMNLNIIDSIETVDYSNNYSNPFDELPQEQESSKKEESQKTKDIEIEAVIVEKHAYINLDEEVEVVPFEQEDDEHEETPEEILNNELYQELTAKVYERDYDLGECFEKNFIFDGFADKKLHIISRAQDEDRKLLYKYFGIIKTFAQDVFGNDVELDFKKEEPSQVNNQETKKEEAPAQSEPSKSNDDFTEESGSMLESIEMGSGCVADMTKSAVVTPSQQELQLNDILNSKMLDKTKELFDIRKITVKSRS
ncbi:MAG: DNA polymerase III subunit gamma/tau [Aliarcobacter sp.]|nr:DNA polymerase III subunit gamma/tau [Aliarcobacter sp.]